MHVNKKKLNGTKKVFIQAPEPNQTKFKSKFHRSFYGWSNQVLFIALLTISKCSMC